MGGQWNITDEKAARSAVHNYQPMGPDNLDNPGRLAEQFQKQMPGAEAGASIAAAQDDDDDVPELVPGETFEEAAEDKKEPEAKKEPESKEKKESL